MSTIRRGVMGTADIALGIAHLPLLDFGPPELFDVAARAGYQRVGLRMHSAAPGTKVYPVERGQVAALRAAARAAGVEVFDAEFIQLSRDLDVAALDGWMATAAELGAKRVNCGASGDDPDLARNVERFGALCDVAARHGLGVDLEFMRWRKPVASISEGVQSTLYSYLALPPAGPTAASSSTCCTWSARAEPRPTSRACLHSSSATSSSATPRSPRLRRPRSRPKRASDACLRARGSCRSSN